MAASKDYYNGWATYATWRVKLEMLDGITLSDIGFRNSDSSSYSVYLIARHLEDYVEQIIIDTTPEGIGRDYALALVDQVDFDQIAEHMIEDEA